MRSRFHWNYILSFLLNLNYSLIICRTLGIMAKKSKYSVSFSIGSLFINEVDLLIDYLIDQNLKENINNIVSENRIKINAESSRARIVREIHKRSRNVDTIVWKIYKAANFSEKSILLFYTCCKTFKFILDFQTDVVLEKFKSYSLDLSNNDFTYFVDRKSILYPELEDWSQKRKEKIRWSLFTILEETGLLVDGKITPLKADNEFWYNFIKLGDPWFLELALLNKQQRDIIYGLHK